MRRVAVFVAAFLVWCLLAWPYDSASRAWDTQSIGVGLGAALIVALLFGDTLGRRPLLFLDPVRWFWLLVYLPVFVYYCIQANLHVAYLVLHPAMPIRPGIVRVHTRLRSPVGIAALANSITLTPGTMTVDATEDGVLYIHWIDVQTTDEAEATQSIVAGFETFLRRILE